TYPGTRASTGRGGRRVLVLGLLRARAVGPALAQRPQRRLALVPDGPVEHQHAVEVVDLVLEHARLEPGRLDLQRRAGDVDAAHPGEQGALHVDGYAWKAQTPLLRDDDLVGEPVDS